MKKEGTKIILSLLLYCILLIVLFTIGTILARQCSASDISLSAKGEMYFPTDKEMQTGKIIQVDLQWKAFYMYGSYLEMQRRIAGQRAGDYGLYSIGAGIKVPIHQYLNVWGQFGYYFVSSQMADAPLIDFAHGGETQYLHWQKWGKKYNYDTSLYTLYDYKIKGNFGGAFGIDVKYPIGKHLETGISVGYTLLKLNETFYAYAIDHNQYSGWIETIDSKNMSGIMLGLNITYKF